MNELALDTPVTPREVVESIKDLNLKRVCEEICIHYRDSEVGEGYEHFYDEEDWKNANEELEEHCASCPLTWMAFVNENLKPSWKPFPEKIPYRKGRYIVRHAFDTGDRNEEDDVLYWSGEDWRLYPHSSLGTRSVSAWSEYRKCPREIYERERQKGE